MKVNSERFCLPDSTMTKGAAALREKLPVSESKAYAQYACFKDLEKNILKLHKKVDYSGDKILTFLRSRKNKWNFSTINISLMYKKKKCKKIAKFMSSESWEKND